MLACPLGVPWRKLHLLAIKDDIFEHIRAIIVRVASRNHTLGTMG